jgi:hypothetical protein
VTQEEELIQKVSNTSIQGVWERKKEVIVQKDDQPALCTSCGAPISNGGYCRCTFDKR